MDWVHCICPEIISTWARQAKRARERMRSIRSRRILREYQNQRRNFISEQKFSMHEIKRRSSTAVESISFHSPSLSHDCFFFLRKTIYKKWQTHSIESMMYPQRAPKTCSLLHTIEWLSILSKQKVRWDSLYLYEKKGWLSFFSTYFK